MRKGCRRTAFGAGYCVILAAAGFLSLPTALHAGMDEGLEAVAAGHYRVAFEEWLPLAEDGDAAASYNLGQLYRMGRGVARDYARAARWYRVAAERDYPPAQHNLALLYEHGLGVPIDYGAARLWYRKAAEQGHAPAQFNLAVMHSIGQGAPRDLVRAHLWYSLAAAQGDEQAATNREVLAQHMSAAEIAQAQKLARDWPERK